MCTRIPGPFVETDAQDGSTGIWLENKSEFHWLGIARVVRISRRCTRLPNREACGAVRDWLRRLCADLGRIRGLVLAVYCRNDVVVNGSVRQSGIDVTGSRNAAGNG